MEHAAFLVDVMDDLLRPYADQDEDSVHGWVIDRLMDQSLASLCRQLDQQRLSVEVCLDQLRDLASPSEAAWEAIWRAEARLEWIALVKDEITLSTRPRS